jgi:hypothetical protein
VANRRIGGAGGGSDPGSGKSSDAGSGKSSGGGAVLAVSIAIVIGVGGITATGTATLTSGASSASSSVSNARTTSRGSSQDTQAVEGRLVRQGFRVNFKATSDGTDCVGHSYGQVQNFFRQHPCSALYRAYFEVQDRQGDTVLVAVSWVRMPDEPSASALKHVDDVPGTGNVTELSREEGKYRSVRYTGQIYASALDTSGTVFANVQAQPVARGTTGVELTSLVTNALP